MDESACNEFQNDIILYCRGESKGRGRGAADYIIIQMRRESDSPGCDYDDDHHHHDAGDEDGIHTGNYLK